jgi:3-hydroxybutyryl-CoA dehydrogenase
MEGTAGGSEQGRAVVIGGGTMGAGIAAVLARAGIAVELAEVDAELAQAAVARARGVIDDGVARGRVEAGAGETAKALIEPVVGVAGARPEPRLAIEAVPERLELKRAVLGEIESLAPGLVATNTSGISIDELAAGLDDPSRLIGLHFFNPVAAMALVEVVVGSDTSDQTRADAIALVAEIGKESVVVRDAPGFATSRLGLALGLEAIRMVEDGVAEPADIDRAMVLGYRHPVGPLRLTDIVGLDVRLDIARNLRDAYGERFTPPLLLERMVAEGKLGKKSGEGFYAWEDDA